MGYAEKKVFFEPSLKQIHLKPEIAQLSEVIVSAPKLGKFKLKKQKALTHDDLFACWLPTVESEVAVLFKRYESKATQISKLHIPINAERNYKSKGKGNFATIFRIHMKKPFSPLMKKQTKFLNSIFCLSPYLFLKTDFLFRFRFWVMPKKMADWHRPNNTER